MITKNIFKYFLFLLSIFPTFCMKFLLFQSNFGVRSTKTYFKPIMCNEKNKNYIRMSKKEHELYQWKIFKKSFEGNWHAPYSYLYDSNKILTDIIYNTNSKITIFNNNTCIINNDNNINQLYYYPNTLNINNTVFLFTDCAGKSCKSFNNSDRNTFMMEINFFYKNIRSVIQIRYKSYNNNILLDSIYITPFRNKLYSNTKYIKELSSIYDFINIMSDNIYGERFYYNPNKYTYDKMILSSFNLFPYLSTDNNIFKGCFEDGLVVIIPKKITLGEHFKLLFGAYRDNKYKQLIINYDINGNLTNWIYDSYIKK